MEKDDGDEGTKPEFYGSLPQHDTDELIIITRCNYRRYLVELSWDDAAIQQPIPSRELRTEDASSHFLADSRIRFLCECIFCSYTYLY